MSETTQNLEQEIETHRAGVEETLDKLKQRLSVDQLVSDMGQFLGVENVRDTLHAAGRQVRENPMALALIGAGVARLMMGSGSGTEQSRNDWRGESDAGYGGASGDKWQSYSGGRDRLDPSEESLVGKARATVSDLGETLGEVPSKVRDAVGRATEGVQSSVETVRERAGSSVRPVTDQIAANPLLVGAVSVAIGAILGSALPRTRTENRLLGPQRDRLMDAATRAGSDMGGRMAEAARTTYDAAAAAARDEGLLPDANSPTLAQKMEHVATAAVDAASAQVEPVLSGSDDGEAGSDAVDSDRQTGIEPGADMDTETSLKTKRQRG